MVNRVVRRLKKVKAGHAGTLDPLATGVLIVCVGPATKLISHVQSQTKEYVSTFRLGQTSDTDDCTGTIMSEADAAVTVADIASALKDLTGCIMQVPPQYSAVHVKGERAYKRAREGQPVEIEPREVEINQIEILDYVQPELKLRIVCGSGTYIRSIARDLGEKLGCGALMSQLVRTRIGPFGLADALSVDDLQKADLQSKLTAPGAAVAQLPAISLADPQLTALLHGRSFASPVYTEKTCGLMQLLSTHGELVGIGEMQGDRVQPKQVFLRPKQTP